MEIPPLSLSITFASLHTRLLTLLRTRVQNGELTERSLARITGISQPHIHNVLKGARTLSPELADVILARLRLTPLDLLAREEIIGHLNRTNPHREQRLHPVPVLEGLLGCGHPIPRKGPHREIHTVPYSLMATTTDPLVVSLAEDPEMAPLFSNRDLVLLDQSETARSLVQPNGYYVVQTERGPCVRSVLREGDGLFLITEQTKHNPEAWERVTLPGGDLLDIVLARIVWLNRRRRWEDQIA